MNWAKTSSTAKKTRRFTAGKDVLLDKQIVVWDALGSVAHALMLHRIGVLNDKELEQLLEGLGEILEKGLELKPGLEDVHSNIEFFLTKKYGKAGKKLHTARSRNDQATLDMLLFIKSRLLEAMNALIDLCRILEEKTRPCLMPGFTHLQKAMPTTWAHWLMAYHELLLCDIQAMLQAYDLVDKNPLGAGASYGSMFDLDVNYTTRLLGFKQPFHNSLAAISSRGKNEFITANALVLAMLDLSRLAEDMLVFNLLGLVKFGGEVTTGSSMMPQKRNLDVLELVRAKTAKALALQTQIATTLKGTPMAYNRDVQETKQAVMEAFQETIESVHAVTEVMKTVKPDEERMLEECTPEILATDKASILVKKGMPFREAYHAVKEGAGVELSVSEAVEKKTHVGAPSHPHLVKDQARALTKTEAVVSKKQKDFYTAVGSLSSKALKVWKN